VFTLIYGVCPGFMSELLLQTDDNIGVVTMINANGTNPGQLAHRAYEIVSPALKTAKKGTDQGADQGAVFSPELEKYIGAYNEFPWGGESAVFPWEDGLAVLSLPTDDPLKAIAKLKQVDGNRFRRVRSDDTLGEEIVFELDSAGNVLSMRVHSNPYARIRTSTH
jgi:hypothetical protein